MKYKAFISYRHCELDSEVAKKIIKSVESYGIPKTIAEKQQTNKHVGKLFRDEDELAAADNLSEVITEALDESEYFIMVCSPRYIESEWCMLEVRHWINRNGRKNIVAVLVEGEPSESFPVILTDYTENGKHIHIEPLAVDVRGASQKEVLKNIDIQKFRIISSLIGCDYDDLRQRQQERAKKNTIGIFGSVFSVFALIVAIILVSNFKLNEKNIELEQLHGSLEEAQTELDSRKKELDIRNGEIKEREDSLAELNVSVISKMADVDMLSENRAAASAEKLLAYKKTKELGLGTSGIFNELIDYSDMYNNDLAKKVKSTPIELDLYRDRLECGNSRYFKFDDYFYDVFKNESIYYVSGDSSYISAEYLPLEGSKFASVYVDSNYDNDSPSELIVRVMDISDGSEKEYRYEFDDYFVSIYDYLAENGKLIVLTDYYDYPNDYYDIFEFDYECNLIDRHSLVREDNPFHQILNSETLLFRDEIYNFVTGEKTEFEGDIPIRYLWMEKNYRNKVYSKYDSELKSYVFSEENHQYDYAAILGDYIFYSDVNPYKAKLYLYNVKTKETEAVFDDGIDTYKLRFSVSDSGSVLAYSDDENICIRNINGDKNSRKCSGNVKKLAVSDNYLVVLYYDKNPEVIYFDYETMDFIEGKSDFEKNYDEVILCGNVLHMFSRNDNIVDTYYLNDFSGCKAVTVPTEEFEKYNQIERNVNYSAGDNFAVVAYSNESENLTPTLYIFDSNSGSLLRSFEVSDEFAGRYETSEGEIRYNCPYAYDEHIEGKSYKNDNKELFIPCLVNYKDSLNPNDSAEPHIVDINYYNSSAYGNVAYITQWHSDGTDFEYNSEKKDHGTFGGAVYNLAEGKLIEEVEFFDRQTTDFYIYENIRVESGDYGIRIYDEGKHINSFNATNFYPCNDPDLITMLDNDRWVIFSLTQNKEMLSVEADKKLSSHKVRFEENGGNFVLFECRYLIDTEKLEIIHDFGEISPVTYTNLFLFNEYLGLWEFGIVNGKVNMAPTEVIFCYPDTFEEAFSVDKLVIQSSDGKYFYELDGYASRKSDESRAFWQVPLLKEEEVAEKAEKMLSDLGITEEEIEALDTMSAQ